MSESKHDVSESEYDEDETSDLKSSGLASDAKSGQAAEEKQRRNRRKSIGTKRKGEEKARIELIRQNKAASENTSGQGPAAGPSRSASGRPEAEDAPKKPGLKRKKRCTEGAQTSTPEPASGSVQQAADASEYEVSDARQGQSYSAEGEPEGPIDDTGDSDGAAQGAEEDTDSEGVPIEDALDNLVFTGDCGPPAPYNSNAYLWGIHTGEDSDLPPHQPLQRKMWTWEESKKDLCKAFNIPYVPRKIVVNYSDMSPDIPEFEPEPKERPSYDSD